MFNISNSQHISSELHRIERSFIVLTDTLCNGGTRRCDTLHDLDLTLLVRPALHVLQELEHGIKKQVYNDNDNDDDDDDNDNDDIATLICFAYVFLMKINSQ